MKITNFEFKARTQHVEALEQKLLKLDPLFRGEDHQTDTYFNVSHGRLKLREGSIENALIYYERQNTATAKQSDVLLYQHDPNRSLKDILTKVHCVKVVVDKRRRIYFIDNVKFHFDVVEGLGTFVEVEAIDNKGNIPIETLKAQCRKYFEFFGLREEDFVEESYSDLLLKRDSAGSGE